ncbi:MAG: aspartate/glutamate racemase family protein [Alphaproteobacteria bacterium]|nr:aspartate/glutamate racemase family protein [Alphaproteobacteria bacterium]
MTNHPGEDGNEVTIGILMLNTRFRRWPGDIGNPETFPFPVRYRVIEDARPVRVTGLHDKALLEPFIAAGHELAAEGVAGITTTCGFLSVFQDALVEALGIPVATSALLQVPLAQRLIPEGRRVGVLTFDGDALIGAYLEDAGVPADTPVEGIGASSRFVRSILEGDDTVPFEVLRADALAAAERLIAQTPSIGAIVSECTNLAPFSTDIADRFGLPVFDINTLVHWLHDGMRPRRYPRPLPAPA